MDLLLSIGRQYTVQGEYTKVRKLLTQAYTLARGLPERSTRARTACALAQASRSERDVPAAETLIQEGLDELPMDGQFALDRIFCLQRGSEIAVRRGDSIVAVSRARAAETELRRLPFRSELLEVDNLMILGSACRFAGQAREANAAFEQASARLSTLGREDTQRARRLFNHWGTALHAWGRPIEGERMLRRAIALGEDNRAADVAVAPMVFNNYAGALTELGRLDEAAAFAERAYARARIDEDGNAIYRSLLTRASIHRSRGETERAAQLLSEAEPILQRDLPVGHIAFAAVAVQKALIAQALGDFQTGLDLVNQAVATAEQRIQEGREGMDSLKSFLLTRSTLQLQVGQPHEAEADARRALKMLEAQPGAVSSNLGRAYMALGRALQAQRRPEEARPAFRSAVEHLQSALGSDHRETREALKLAEL